MLQGHPVKVIGRPKSIAISGDLEVRIASLLAGSWGRAARSHLVTRINPALLVPGR